MEKTKLKTIDIKGKSYTTVDARVQFFREKYPAYTIETEYPILDLEKGICVCRAIIRDENGKMIADGFAHEWKDKPGSMVNKTSYIENAQTSAIGRALGFLGIGINGMGIATADEVSLKIQHDADEPAPIDDTIPTFEHADDWLTVNAFQGIAERCTDISELQKIINGQRTNPQISELIAIASARKAEIVAAQQGA